MNKNINKNKTISFRLNSDLRDKMLKHIELYGFKNISSFVLYAIEKELYRR